LKILNEKHNKSVIGNYSKSSKDINFDEINNTQSKVIKKKIKLEDLEILWLLGQGSFGKVKLCRNIKDGKYYALKCLLKEQIKGKKQIQHIINEKYIL
jgi:hypothetical protein